MSSRLCEASLSYRSIVDGMDESATGSAPSLLLLPAHKNLNCDDDDEQPSYVKRASSNIQAKHHSSNTKNLGSTKANPTTSSESACTLDMLNDSQRQLNANNSTNINSSLLAVHDENQHDGNSTALMPQTNTAPIAKIITVKTYRPAKIGAALIVLLALFLLLIAAVSSEWLGRYDVPESAKGTTFYRYGFFEFCHGYIVKKTGETYDVKCRFWPILHKTWVQLCAGLYGATIFISIGAFALLCAAFKLETDNVSKWRLYKAAIGLLLAACFLLASCLLIWSTRFLFEVSILHRQRLYASVSPDSAAYPWLPQGGRPNSQNQLGQTTKFSPIFFPSRKSTVAATSETAKKSTPAPYQYNPPPSQMQRNVTITGDMTREIHSTIWPQVMSSVVCGWAYILAWIGVLLLILPAVLLIIDGKKDEHVCEEQLVYPNTA